MECTLRPAQHLVSRLIRSHRLPLAVSGGAKRQQPFSSRPPAFPETATATTVAACPAPSCECAGMPEMPDGYPLDREPEKVLRGQVPRYREQVLACTGRDDWPSRIEFEAPRPEDGGRNVAAQLKAAFGRGGKFCDPFNPISVHNVSFPSASATAPGSSLYLFPSFTYIPSFTPRNMPQLAETLGYPWTSKDDSDAGIRPPTSLEAAAPHFQAQEVTDIMILICGHGGRDPRCGILGPILQREFADKLNRVGVTVLDGAERAREKRPPGLTSRVGLISHVGGHALAGNAIIYMPPKATLPADSGQQGSLRQPHPLAGCGLWYGRVEPRHVEGLVAETLLRGRVVEELFRGGIGPDRSIF